MEARIDFMNQAQKMNSELEENNRRSKAKRLLLRIVSGAVKAAIAFAFVAALLSFLRLSTLVYEINSNNLKLEQEIHSMQIKVQELEVEIKMQTMLKNIETTAINEFGMVYPDQAQVVRLVQYEYYALGPGDEEADDHPRLARLNR